MHPPKISNLTLAQARHRFWLGLLLVTSMALLVVEPALANKFETIGGGVSGSSQLKLEWLKGFLYVVGGISLLSGLMALFVPHNNALFLNFSNWKQSAVVLFVLAGICFGGAVMM